MPKKSSFAEIVIILTTIITVLISFSAYIVGMHWIVMKIIGK